jgi:photosystem II stability/assembly factor-like uncharacterized protein
MRYYTAFLGLLMLPLLACQQNVSIAQPAPQQCTAKTLEKVLQSNDNGDTWHQLDATGLPEGANVGGTSVFGNQLVLQTSKGFFMKPLSTTSVAAPAVWQRQFDSMLEEVSSVYQGKDNVYGWHYRDGVYQWVPGINMWNHIDKTLNDKSIRGFKELPDGTLLAGCETGMFRSTDKGAKWQRVTNDFLMINSLMTFGEVLISGTEEGIMRSTDGGQTWQYGLKGVGGAFGITAITGGIIAVGSHRSDSITADPFLSMAGGGLIAVADESRGADRRVNQLFTSHDAGQTWQVFKRPPGMERDVHDIAYVNGYLYISHDHGVSRTSDGGKTWDLVLPPSEDRNEIIRLEVVNDAIVAFVGAGC